MRAFIQTIGRTALVSAALKINRRFKQRKTNYALNPKIYTMKKNTILLFTICFTAIATMAQVAINEDGSTADASAMLDVKSTSKGFLLPRMTEGQIALVSSPAAGLTVFNTDDNRIYIYDDGAGEWKEVAVNTTVLVPTVYNPTTGKTWMDRNLGASQVATSSTDTAAFGDLYQWGRLTDGHEIRSSSTISASSSTDVPGHSDYITTISATNYDWRYPQNNNLWQGESGINNPCPSGFRLPTDVEWDDERQSWASNDAAGAYGSPLKLTVNGIRGLYNASLYQVGVLGYYYSSTISGTRARYLHFKIDDALLSQALRADGMAVRCIKD